MLCSTLDGGNDGGYYGMIAAIGGRAAGKQQQLTLSGDACWQHKGGYTWQNCSTEPKVVGGKTGHAVTILHGPGKGQWRRVVGISGARGRTVTLDSPFNPLPAVGQSAIQIGQMRGQISIVGNTFVKGGDVQLYAACYDCLVAENTFGQFGFTNCE